MRGCSLGGPGLCRRRPGRSQLGVSLARVAVLVTGVEKKKSRKEDGAPTGRNEGDPQFHVV